ncbi:MAG: 3-ketoacyl-ACP reductase [Candidatus Lokiarchaeota archaeon]|nr:3-ketoacyl-ACP reductase [Candidatus Lokiarchaeota archaeon]
MEKKVALVTGSSRGIGFAIGTRLIAEGHVVIFNGVASPALAPDKIEALQNMPGHREGVIKYVQADVSSAHGRDTLLAFIKTECGGRIDLLVNNAGMAPRERKDILAITPGEYRELMGVNLEGPFFLTQAVAKLMLDLAANSNIPSYRPCIINISSISAYTASIDRPAYCMSKAGVSMMTALYATRLAGNIPVHEIRPGIIETDMTAGVMEKYKRLISDGLLPIKRIGKPEDVAEAVAAIACGQLPYSTGNVLDVDGGFHLRRL